MSFADINGTQLYYELVGESHDETIVMIHAGICDSRMWRAQVEHFSQHFRVLTLDLRGFGQSKMVEKPFSLQGDVVTLMRHLNIDMAWLMAASLGGKLAINIALTQPELVKGLLLVGPALGGYEYEGPEHPLTQAFEDAEEKDDIAAICELEMQMWIDGKGRKPDDVDPDVRQLVYDMNLIALNVPDELWDYEIEDNAPSPPAIERLNEIRVPTLVVLGELDVLPTFERAEIIVNGIKGAKKVMMPTTAHVPNMEFPDEFNAIVDGFLT